MKNLILMVALISFQYINAQNPQLMDTDWYLQKLIIDNVEEIMPQSTSSSLTTFSILQIIVYNNNSCLDTSFTTSVDYSGLQDFSIGPDGPVFPSSCSDANVQMFFNHHTYAFYQVGNLTISFTYTINEIDTVKELIVTNSEGDRAFYRNALLSSKSFSKNTFAIAPNPVNDILTFSGIDQKENTSINIYDVLGKRVFNIAKFDLDKKSIDVSNLESGIYFIKFNNLETRKFVKK